MICCILFAFICILNYSINERNCFYVETASAQVVWMNKECLHINLNSDRVMWQDACSEYEIIQEKSFV